MTRISEPAPAKLNLALHVRGRRADKRHDLETVFAFCTDGDVVHAEPAATVSLAIEGPFAKALTGESDNLVKGAAAALGTAASTTQGARITLTKNLPVASGIGGGSADAAATLRLLTRLWQIAPDHASRVAPTLGSDVPACLLSMTSRGEGAGDRLKLVDAGVSGSPVLLVNPRAVLSTGAVFAAWNGIDQGPLGDWRTGRNDLEAPARSIVPVIGEVIDWLAAQQGASMARMSGSGATCFALFANEAERDLAAAACPQDWWHLATFLR